jgi:hypothetical protein|tara:strand:- start:188 stop:589 length:402 start_codon:yes stop_codon:yes gene_type:complete
MRWFLLFLIYAPAAYSAPVIPSFTQGTMTSHTETTSRVTETIVSENYKTGYEYVVAGKNIQHDGNSISPPSTTSVDTWTGLDLSTKPNWTLKTPGGDFQYTETYIGPGLSNVTTIQRVTEITSVTDTVSSFSE